MKQDNYLIFSVRNCLYGIKTVEVKEIFYLPELIPIPKAPRQMVGVVNLREEIFPVIDLNLSVGNGKQDYKLTDSLVVLQGKKVKLGIIVDEVHEVRNISEKVITTELYHGRDLVVAEGHNFIEGIAKSSRDILILSNAENLLKYVEKQEFISVDRLLENAITDRDRADKGVSNDTELWGEQHVFSPNATPEERLIFRQRAEHLRESLELEDFHDSIPLAVIVLNGEFFGIDLKMVREFTKIHKFTPIPCCPPHIVGNTNLRGEILTLVDISALLNLPLINVANSFSSIVVEVEGIVAGLVLEEVRDVIFLNPADIKADSTKIDLIDRQYLQGMAPYQGKMMSILDLPTILLDGGLIVDEAV